MIVITILSIIFGSLFVLYNILRFFNNLRFKVKFERPRSRIVYYNNKEYRYKMKSAFFTFLGDLSINKTRIKVYKVIRILGIPFYKHINTSDKIYTDSSELKSLDNFKRKIINLIEEYNNKDLSPGWDGCLDEISRQARKRAKNIDTIIDE